MVTQMNTFFPVPASNMGNGAAPAQIDPATGQAIPFTQVLTQTQAQMNPLMLAMLNGMAGLSPQPTSATAPVTPPINAEIPAETPGQETSSATPDANLLTLAGLSMTSIVMPNSTDWELDHLQYGTAAVPEPATVYGVVAAIAVFAGLRRRS